MISDHVKGKSQYDFSPGIQKGIQLHRMIDNFTDNHTITKQLKSYFKPHYRLYAGAFADITYDHFLANDNKQFFSAQDLKQFAAFIYSILEINHNLLPVSFQRIFPYMKKEDWLYTYQYKWGIEKSYNGLVYRAAYLTESNIAFDLFNKYYSEIRLCHEAFYPLLKNFTSNQLQQLLNA